MVKTSRLEAPNLDVLHFHGPFAPSIRSTVMQTAAMAEAQLRDGLAIVRSRHCHADVRHDEEPRHRRCRIAVRRATRRLEQSSIVVIRRRPWSAVGRRPSVVVGFRLVSLVRRGASVARWSLAVVVAMATMEEDRQVLAPTTTDREAAECS